MANVTIGSNVFIGAHSIVLPGVTIGDNVIIGAGSIVSRNIPSNSVSVGAPAKVIKPLSEYLEVRKKEMLSDNTFGEEYTMRSPYFGEKERKALLNAANTHCCIFVE